MFKNVQFFVFVLSGILCLLVSGCGGGSPQAFLDAVKIVQDGGSTTIITNDIEGVGDKEIALLEGLEGLRELRINRSDITEDAIQSIVKIPNLEVLSLGETKTNDAMLAPLANHPTLVHLSLDKTRITDKGLESIATIPNLRELSLWSNAITDSGCQSLAKIPNLQWVSLDETRITGKGLKSLQDLKNLRKVQVWRTGVKEEDIESFQKAKPNCEVTH